MTNGANDSSEDESSSDHMDTPVAGREPVEVVDHPRVARILGLYSQFIVPSFKDASSWFVDAVYLACGDEIMPLVHELLVTTIEELIENAKSPIGQGKYMIDVVKDVAIPLVATLAGNVFPFDLQTPKYEGDYSLVTLGRALLAIRIHLFANDDPAMAERRRSDSENAMSRLKASSERYMSKIMEMEKESSLRTYNEEWGFTRLRAFTSHAICCSLEKGVSEKEMANSVISATLSFAGPAVTSLTEILHFLIADDENSHHLAALQDFCAKGSTKEIESYALEIQRLTNAHSITLTAAEDTVVHQQPFTKGDVVVCRLADASRDPAVFPDPDEIKLDRPRENYLPHTPKTWALFEHEIMNEFFIVALKHILSLEGLRPLPGEKGELKKVVPEDGGNPRYSDESGSNWCAYASTWKLQFNESS